eukprot:1159721-Pelagomonas_calceolata.AAC.7
MLDHFGSTCPGVHWLHSNAAYLNTQQQLKFREGYRQSCGTCRSDSLSSEKIMGSPEAPAVRRRKGKLMPAKRPCALP